MGVVDLEGDVCGRDGDDSGDSTTRYYREDGAIYTTRVIGCTGDTNHTLGGSRQEGQQLVMRGPNEGFTTTLGDGSRRG